MKDIPRAGLTDEDLISMGLMTMLWGQLELFTNFIIMILGEVHRDAGPAIVGRKPMSAKRVVINQLVADGVVKSEKTKDRLRELTRAIDGVMDRRNHVTHGNMSLNRELGKVQPFVYKHMAAHKDKMRNFDLNQLVLDLNEAVNLASKCIVIVAREKDPVPPDPQHPS